MKWVQYLMKNGLQARVAINKTVEETVASLQDEMLDPLAFVVIDDGTEPEQSVDPIAVADRLALVEALAAENAMYILNLELEKALGEL